MCDNDKNDKEESPFFDRQHRKKDKKKKGKIHSRNLDEMLKKEKKSKLYRSKKRRRNWTDLLKEDEK